MASATDIGGNAEQQDRAINLTLPSGAILSAVADGHGPHGARVAQWAMDWITDSAAGGEAPLNAATFAASSGAGGGINSSWAGMFAAIDEHIRMQLLAHLTATDTPHMTFGKGIYRRGFYGSRGMPIRGGTTLSIALVGPDGDVHAAHVGDSNIHVFTEHEDAEGVSLTGDHTPTSKSEFDRIRALHPGAMFTMDASTVGLPREYDRHVWTRAADDTDIIEQNPLGPFKYSDVRCGWASYLRTSDDSEGIAMTRALGDFNLQLLAGVITEPHCQDLPALAHTDAGPRERVVVNASDGFWDIVHYAEIAEVIWQAENRGSAEATAAALLALGKAKTLERLGEPGDNMTVSVVRVLAPRPAPAPAPVPVPVPSAAVGGAGAAAESPDGDCLDDPALWEAAVQRYNPLDSIPLSHSPNGHQQAEGQDEMVRSGAVPGTGFWYFGRGSTMKLIYRSLDGRYWDITYRQRSVLWPYSTASWRLTTVEPWYHSSHGTALP
jgi:serine/threonine protein phosphatase PrpC